MNHLNNLCQNFLHAVHSFRNNMWLVHYDTEPSRFQTLGSKLDDFLQKPYAILNQLLINKTCEGDVNVKYKLYLLYKRKAET